MGVEEDKPGKKPLRTQHGEIHDPAVSGVHEKAKRDHQRDHNHTVAQADNGGTALSNGRRGLSHRSSDESLTAKRKKEKESQYRFLKESRRLQQELQDRLAAIDRELDDIRKGREAITDLKQGFGPGLSYDCRCFA